MTVAHPSSQTQEILVSLISSLIIWFIIEFILEIVVWGIGGFLLFRLFGINEKHWYYDAIVMYFLFMAYQYVCISIILTLDISIANKEWLELFDGDSSFLYEMDYFDYILSAIQILIGYRTGKLILKKIRIRS